MCLREQGQHGEQVQVEESTLTSVGQPVLTCVCARVFLLVHQGDKLLSEDQVTASVKKRNPAAAHRITPLQMSLIKSCFEEGTSISAISESREQPFLAPLVSLTALGRKHFSFYFP